MDVSQLEKMMDEALKNYCNRVDETKRRYASNSELQEAISYLSSDVFRCLNDFEKAILDYEKQK